MLFCAMPLTVAGCTPSAEAAAQEGVRAEQLLGAGKLNEARAAISAAIAKRDDLAQLHIIRGRIEVAMRAYDNAYLAYFNALSLDATNAEALQGVAQLGLQQGHFFEAEQAADRIVALQADQPDALLVKGLLSLLRSKPAEAIAFADRILASNAGNEGGTILKARALAVSGQVPAALALTEKAATTTGYTQGITRTLVELYRVQRNLPALVDMQARAIGLSPRDADLTLDYANTLYKIGRTAEARERLIGLLDDQRHNLKALDQAAMLWREYDSAPLDPAQLQAFAQSGSIEARMAAARYYIATRQFATATVLLQAILPNQSQAARALNALALERAGKSAEAKAIADAVLDTDATNADALLVKVAQALRANRIDAAIIDAQRVVRDNPKLEDGYRALAVAYAAQRRDPGIRRAFEDGIRKLPQNVDLHNDYADWLLTKDSGTRALSATRELARDTPASIRAWQLYGRICAATATAGCAADAAAGLARARTTYGIDQPPGTAPTRGLFGRLR